MGKRSQYKRGFNLMRMWMLPPEKMCRKHLLGEHVEIHMLVGSIIKGRKLTKFLSYGLIEPTSIYKRHEEIKNEMIKRGYKHTSELKKYDFSKYNENEIKLISETKVDINKSILDITERCSECLFK